MKKIPYAMANFLTMREENYLCIDRTSYIRTLENMSGKSFLFICPRRFGKSLWLNVMSDKFEMTFKGVLKQSTKGSFARSKGGGYEQ